MQARREFLAALYEVSGPMQPVRMSDVAKAAGVSTMTVSRVLNQSNSVLDDTRQRVFAAVERLGYRRNELARSLRERRSRQIGILVPNLYDPFFAACAHTINTVAREQGYSVSMAMTEENAELEYEEARRMLQRSVEGLLVVPTDVRGTSRLLSPEFAHLPVITLDRPVSGAGRSIETFVVQNKEGAFAGTEYLLGLGHRRVACMALNRRVYTIRMRISGYEAAMAAAGLPSTVVGVPPTMEETLEQMRVLMAGDQAPTALFCANNLVTRYVLHSLQMMNLHPPESVSLVGFDDFETADLLRPGITVVRQPVNHMAQCAAESLFKRLQEVEPNNTGQRVVLPVELVVRGSCSSPRSGPLVVE